jgi:tryptophanyl-tRNA synthetase
MSSSVANSAILLTDTPAQIRNKVNRHAFSGGQDTAELHRQLGGRTEVDVSYQYLRFFLEDEEELERIKQAYEAGQMSTSELKKKCGDMLADLIGKHQEARKLVTDEVLDQFMSSKTRMEWAMPVAKETNIKDIANGVDKMNV